MNGMPPKVLRTLAFGDFEAGVWGAATGGGEPLALIAAGAPSAPVAPVGAHLTGSGPGADWQLTGPGMELQLTAHADRDPGPADGFAELCRVTGTVTVDGTERAVDVLGLRTEVPIAEVRSLDSIRQVLSWFGEEDGAVLTAQRPRGAKGHERDAVSATVIEPEGPVVVSEGRLSTTYGDGGLPARFGLELWLTDEEDQYPRRVAGERLGVDGAGVVADATVSLHGFRCHSRGRDGGGVYVIARAR
jgi:hypothetical protein